VAALEEEERTILLNAVNRLREQDRMVVGYRYFLGLSERETASALGIPAGTVKSRLARALRRLRTMLETPSGEALAGAQEGGRDG
jgi:RNA polymerase sigma-70 factor (ECF subfamily)